MNTRNLVWLAVIVVVGAIVWISAGFVWGLVAALATLAVSEVVERTRRRRRAQASDTEIPSVKNALTNRRRSR